MIEQAKNRAVIYTAILLLLSLVTLSSRAAGPSADSTVAFLNSKFQQHGGGYAMEINDSGRFYYSRIFPLSVTMEQDGQLLVRQIEQGFERPQQGAPDEVDQALQALASEGGVLQEYLIPIGDMEFGRISNRLGDWPALKTLKKSSARVRIVCQDNLNCITLNQQQDGQYFDLYISDENHREKVFNAFKHLIGLYRIRKELF